MISEPGITLQRTFLGALAVAMLAGFLPAGIAMDRRLAAALEDRARTDLALAPRILTDRMAATSDAMMMHAKELAQVPGLPHALSRGDRAEARRLIDSARTSLGGSVPLLVARDGATWSGPTVDVAFVAETHAGRMPVATELAGPLVLRIALAPVQYAGQWVGAAGLANPFDDQAAGLLAGLTRSGVVIATSSGRATGTTLDSTITAALLTAALDSIPRFVDTPRGRYLATAAPLSGAAVVIFSRSMADELTLLPALRRIAAIAALAALSVALLLGAILAAFVTRPVQDLAAAASALAEERFTAPLPVSRIREVLRVSAAFDVMRRALAARLHELRRANITLSDRNAKLTALQSELMQRDRLAASGRLVTQLAHEIRNPVASLRNCLELIRRRVTHDQEAVQFTDMAIDELLRMHELAEQMLDLNRPRGTGSQACSPLAVAGEVERLMNLGADLEHCRIECAGDPSLSAAIAPDALKQVLLNTVQNAREALAMLRPPGRAGIVTITVRRAADDVVIDVDDNGPGITAEDASRLFDPFFTTKGAMHGVGLGLFVAEGLIRSAGGRMTAHDRGGSGARFRIELPVAESLGVEEGQSFEAGER
ncbi:MAG: ATP-binding protein [bacterium]